MEVTFTGFIEKALHSTPCAKCQQPFVYAAIQSAGMRKATLGDFPGTVPEFFMDLTCTNCAGKVRMDMGMPLWMGLMCVSILANRFRGFTVKDGIPEQALILTETDPSGAASNNPQAARPAAVEKV